jgi:fluoride ion exporter CrcB/FEX
VDADRYATCALLIADHAAGFPDYRAHDSIEWGTWRCNIAALLILSCDRCGQLPAHHFVSKMTGSFCGALSAFGSTADESVRFMRQGRLDESALNLGLNIAAVLVFLWIVLSCGGR